jgi:hypothetical protein
MLVNLMTKVMIQSMMTTVDFGHLKRTKNWVTNSIMSEQINMDEGKCQKRMCRSV